MADIVGDLSTTTATTTAVMDSGTSMQPPLLALDILAAHEEELDGLSVAILRHVVAWLDGHGAAAWNLRLVGVLSALLFYTIRVAFRKARGVDWYALLHALVSTWGSLACVYLDYAASEIIAGPEPLRSCQCQGPLTSMHRLMPAITMGYSLFDLIDGLSISVDFAMHGLATFAVMAYYIEQGVPQFVTPMLLMEASTPFLTVVRAEFFTPFQTLLVQLGFVLHFFAFRIVIVPILWGTLMKVMWQTYETAAYQSCIASHVMPVSFLFGCFFNCLNTYWFVKIIKKILRKISGKEGIKDKNDLSDESDPNMQLQPKQNLKPESLANGTKGKRD